MEDTPLRRRCPETFLVLELNWKNFVLNRWVNGKVSLSESHSKTFIQLLNSPKQLVLTKKNNSNTTKYEFPPYLSHSRTYQCPQSLSHPWEWQPAAYPNPPSFYFFAIYIFPIKYRIAVYSSNICVYMCLYICMYTIYIVRTKRIVINVRKSSHTQRANSLSHCV